MRIDESDSVSNSSFNITNVDTSKHMTADWYAYVLMDGGRPFQIKYVLLVDREEFTALGIANPDNSAWDDRNLIEQVFLHCNQDISDALQENNVEFSVEWE